MIRPLFILRFAGLATLLVQLVVWFPRQAIRDDYSDTDTGLFYRTAVKIKNQQPIYGETRTSLYIPHNAFFYPPTFATILRPAANLDVATFAKLWYTVILASYWLLAWALTRIAFMRLCRIDHVLAIGTVLQLVPGIYFTMGHGNVDVMVWALVAWALSLRRTSVAVVLLIVATWIKVYPIFAIPVLLARHAYALDLRSCPSQDSADLAMAFLLTIGPGLVTTAGLAVGMSNAAYVEEWFRVGLASVSAGCLHPLNVSLSTLVVRPFVDSTATSLPHAARTLLSIGPLIGIACIPWFTRKLEARAQTLAVIVGALWLSPVCWWHQLGIGTIGLALWWGWRHRVTDVHRTAAVMIAPLGLIHPLLRWDDIASIFAAHPRAFDAYQSAVMLGADPEHAALETFPEIRLKLIR